MNNTVGWLLAGIFFMIIPVIRFFTGRFSTFWGQPVSWLGDVCLFIFGIILVGYVVFKPQALIKKKYICPKCEETVEDIEGKDISCPKCGTKMEPLKGFYERHPELKDES